MNGSRVIPALAWLVVVVVAGVAGVACGPSDLHTSLLPDKSQAPADIQQACSVAANRCSRCHPLERLELARVSSPEHWGYYVERMRRQPESSISREDARIIVRCLVFRSFGEAGVRAIEAKEEQK